MSKAYRKALASLADIRHRLAEPALSAADRARELAELDAVMATLSGSEHRASTAALAKRVQCLDQQLIDRPAAERNAIVMRRTGISRSRLYELRAVRLSPDSNAR